jgi:glutamyl-tRNA synthetase
MDKKVRVRFAPSPTGGLHLGGVRTVLYNYLFAKQHGGDFVLRIEDTDQTRYVEGAEQYIMDCLKWCGLTPDEGPHRDGGYGPYRQSERKDAYRQYADQLVAAGFAYYAFDTPAELDEMRANFKTDENPSPQYNHTLRMKMRNSLTLGDDEVRRLISEEVPYVIRIRMPENEEVRFTDMIRGEIVFNTNQVDDKVLLKADGMPTYHLAVVVDDFLMKITHAFRGEEWLPSAPVHVLLWKYLDWEAYMPQWAHLPLIMGPNGKLSKRDGAKYGFPVFAMNWFDPKTNELTEGFREKGFLPEAFINMLAVLGWNDGSEQELFTMDELVEKFSLERVHKAGAKFDYEKAKWFNHEWIKKSSDENLAQELIRQYIDHFAQQGIQYDIAPEVFDYAVKVVAIVKDRCTLLPDLWQQAGFFFIAPKTIDTASIKPKWNESKQQFFNLMAEEFSAIDTWESAFIEAAFKVLAEKQGIKAGELQLPFRIMLVGGKFGPPVFDIAGIIGRDNTIARINTVLKLLEEGA